MTTADPHAITTVEALREHLGHPLQGLGEKNQPVIDEFAIDFLERSPLLVLATAGADGGIDASPKGDAPGFVLVEDERTIVIPDRPGNKLAYGHENLLANPKVGLLFMIPGTPETLRINGSAQLSADPALLERLAARGRPAVLAIRVRVEECFFHCGKAFLRSKAWKSEAWPARKKVSFGEMLARKSGAGEEAVQAVDAAIEADYRDNL